MNFTDSFQDFSSKLSTTDIALYAGVGLVLWVMFKDKLSPVQKLVVGLVDKIKGLVSGATATKKMIVSPVSNTTKTDVVTDNKSEDDIFFRLVVSWKQTRDLAEQSNCTEAVKVADQMFPFLSPNVCSKKQD